MQSMTGFARCDGADQCAHWVMEAKSVNAKGLDVRVRAPQGYDGVELALRNKAKAILTRGTIQVSVTLKPVQTGGDVRVNQQALDAYLAAYDDYKDRTEVPSFDGLLRLPGVLQTGEEEGEELVTARLAAMVKDAEKLITDLQASRADEGAALLTVLEGQLGDIAALVEKARAFVADTPDILKARLERGLEAIGNRAADFDEARLHQEVALLIVKADVTEELDRLDGHIAAAKDLLASDQPIGRKFDFLMQEFNREANTLCSKAVDQKLTTIGLDLKTLIDQMKEQIQNVE